MKLMIISDIHGSSYYLKKALELFEKEQADQILILGDILYHGLRNPLPKDYNPVEVAKLLNAIKEKLIVVRGNCDSEVDQMVLEFPIRADYAVLYIDGKKIFATHGHQFNIDQMPNIGREDVLIHGHTHLPVAEATSKCILLNPGSISLPKENNPNSYGIIENNNFQIKTFGGEIIKEINLK